MDKRIEDAMRLHAEGYSCSQCVLMSFADEIGVDRDMAARMGAGLGAGVSCGEICGVASAIAIVAGMRGNDSSSGSKRDAMRITRALLDDFSRPFCGKLTCRDLKGKCGMSCDGLIERGIRILDGEG